MKVIETGIEGLVVLEPRVFGDDRGYFFESYNQQKFTEAGLNYNFVQDNQSFSVYGVVRGLHFQKPPFAQAKLVRALQGKVMDVALDMRKNSPTYGQVYRCELSDENKRQMLIPRGFAHGFSVLSKTAIFSYKCDNFYSNQHEGGICFNDPNLAIDWGIPQSDMIFNERDAGFPTLEEVGV